MKPLFERLKELIFREPDSRQEDNFFAGGKPVSGDEGKSEFDFDAENADLIDIRDE